MKQKIQTTLCGKHAKGKQLWQFETIFSHLAAVCAVQHI